LDAARRSLRAAHLLQLPAARRPLGRRASLTSSHALFAVELLGDLWTPRAAHFMPSNLCSLKLLGNLSNAARRSLQAARP